MIIHKVLRPDSYITALNDYVNQALDLKLEEPSWEFVFNNPHYKSLIINMGSYSNISNSSSMNRIHKNLYVINEMNGNHKIAVINCTFLNLDEIKAELKEVVDGFVLFKNIDLATKEIIEYVKELCECLSRSDEIKWRLILTKGFDFVLPETILYLSLQVSFDVIDIIAHNSVEANKKITVDTCLVKEETLIFNCKF